jgi:hypothetical protein
LKLWHCGPQLRVAAKACSALHLPTGETWKVWRYEAEAPPSSSVMELSGIWTNQDGRLYEALGMAYGPEKERRYYAVYRPLLAPFGRPLLTVEVREEFELHCLLVADKLPARLKPHDCREVAEFLSEQGLDQLMANHGSSFPPPFWVIARDISARRRRGFAGAK